MHPATFLTEVIHAVAARVGAGTEVPVLGTAWQRSVLGSARALYSTEHAVPGRIEWWVVAVASLLALFAVGGVAGRMADRLARRSTPELVVLLNQSAAFYGHWPEDRLAIAPRGELEAEAARCRRIVALLERQAAGTTTPRGSAQRGPIDGLTTWITLLSNRIEARDVAPAGPSYA